MSATKWPAGIMLLLGVLACTIMVATINPSNAQAATLSAEQLKINQRIAQAALIRADAVEAHLDGREFIPAAREPSNKPVTLSVGQLKINQRIAQAAVRRVNELKARAEERPAPVVTPRSSSASFTLSAAQLKIEQRITQAAVRRVNELMAQLGVQLPKQTPPPSTTEPTGTWPKPAISIGGISFKVGERTDIIIRITIPAGGQAVTMIDDIAPKRSVRSNQTPSATKVVWQLTSATATKAILKMEGVVVTVKVYDAAGQELVSNDKWFSVSQSIAGPLPYCGEYELRCD